MSVSQSLLRLYNRAATAPVIGPIVRLPVRILRTIFRPIVGTHQEHETARVADERAQLEIMMLSAAVDRLSEDVKSLRAQLTPPSDDLSAQNAGPLKSRPHKTRTVTPAKRSRK
jgi:hypothetical protein